MSGFGRTGVNYHFVYHPPELNVKILLVQNGLKDDVPFGAVNF